MAKMDVSVSVEKAPYDLMAKLADLIKVVKASGGFSVAAIPAEIAAVVADLPAIVSDCGAIPADLAEDKLAFSKGAVLGADLVVEAVLAK